MGIFPARILLATDGSAGAEAAARTAAELAQKTGSELRVVHVVDVPSNVALLYPGAIDAEWVEGPDPALEEELERQAEQRGRGLLDGEVERVRSAGGTVAQAHLTTGEPAREVVHLAEHIGAGLVVMGSRGRGGIRRALMGSVSDSVVRHAHCPVLVVRGEPVAFPTKVLLATDGSEDAELARTTAADLAKKTDSELHVVTVAAGYPSYDVNIYDVNIPQVVEQLRTQAQKVLDRQVEEIERAGGKVAQKHLRTTERYRAQQILLVAEEIGAGLIVAGSRGLGSVGRALMGSVSDSVVRYAHCPVMVVRH